MNSYQRPCLLVTTCHVIGVCVLLVSTVLSVSCRRVARTDHFAAGHVESSPPLKKTPLNVRSEQSETLFQRRPAAATGIDLVHTFPENASVDMLSDQCSGSGICIADVNGDQLPDIYITNYDQGARLYKNLGNFRFKDVTEEAKVAAKGKWCAGPCFIDIDNDTDLDLYVCVFNQPNLLYINRGDGIFAERARDFRLDFVGASVMMSFADYDMDGDLDAYLVTHRVKDGNHHVLPRDTIDAVKKGIIEIKGKQAIVTKPYRELFQLMPKGPGRFALAIAGQQDILYRNEGHKFHVVNSEAGIHGFGIGLAATWWDFNDDNFPDLYVSNDYKGADQLYRNNGDGTFTDVVQQVLPHVPWYSMGSDVADINNDGLLDFLATDMSGTSHFKQKMAMGDMSSDAWFMDFARPQQYMRNALFVNGGNGRMFEVATMAGIASTDWTWSPKFGDLDNDGRVDLFVANGMSRDFMNSDVSAQVKTRRDQRWKDTPILRQRNLAYRNEGNLRFSEVGRSWGLSDVSASYGASYADLDRDGDLDLVTTNFDGPVSVYQNNSQGNRLSIRLVGKQSNRWGVGSKVTLETGDFRQVRYLNAAQGFMSANEPIIHFGTGEHSTVDRIAVRWPSGNVQEFERLAANCHYVINELASPAANKISEDVRRQPSFELYRKFTGIRHREIPFDDFQAQPLLPKKQSQLGPGIAVADVDDDGVDDYYIGGARGQPGQLILSGKSSRLQPFAADSECEDIGALFFDADSDGDKDLYVVSGGVEQREGSPLFQDRIYLNQGDASFVKSAEALPHFAESGSCVCAADFDRDGDLDLFVGGRIIPGKYPLAPPSRLLRNDEGSFTDVAADVMPGLVDGQIVTGAIWSDANQDGWIDLLVTHEWGTVDLFLNQRGQLQRQTEAAGLAALTGWWNGITGGDVDRDGDIDYVVTNLGLNTKYHADLQHPVRLYYGEFEGRGSLRLVEAKYQKGILLPERGRSCSTMAMPSLGKRFPSYKAFAVAGLEEIYTSTNLENSIQRNATTLESGILLNDGHARFEFRPLARLAQAAPAHGAVLRDLDGDRNLDLVLAQNDFSPQRETGRMDGGMSLLLRGVGDGRFDPIWPSESGIAIADDARAVVTSDIDGDGNLDLVFTINNGEMVALRNTSAPSADRLRIRLIGETGNEDAIGSLVKVIARDGTVLIQEVRAGEGYLSQSSSSRLYFALDAESTKSVEVRWPDGRLSHATPDQNDLTLTQPR